MTRIGFKIDEVFDVLKDLKWHTVDEISKKISQPKSTVRKILRLMVILGHVEYEQERVKTDHKTLKWLRETERNLR